MAADVRSASLPGLTDGILYDTYVVPYSSRGFGALATVRRIPLATPIAQPPAGTWTSAVRVGSNAVVSFGPAVEHGDPLTRWNVVVVQGGKMTAWRQLGPEQRRATVSLAASGDAEVYVFPQSASGYGPVSAPVTVPA